MSAAHTQRTIKIALRIHGRAGAGEKPSGLRKVGKDSLRPTTCARRELEQNSIIAGVQAVLGRGSVKIARRVEQQRRLGIDSVFTVAPLQVGAEIVEDGFDPSGLAWGKFEGRAIAFGAAFDRRAIEIA